MYQQGQSRMFTVNKQKKVAKISKKIYQSLNIYK